MTNAKQFASPEPSAWAPFKHGAFALLRTATLISSLGTWMHDVGAGWLMTQLDPSPAIVAIDYEVEAANQPVFLAAIGQLSGERYRDGAHDWGVYQDTQDPGRWAEWFVVPTWAEHLRQHARATKRDEDLLQKVPAFHKGDELPNVRHLLAPYLRRFAPSPGRSIRPGTRSFC